MYGFEIRFVVDIEPTNLTKNKNAAIPNRRLNHVKSRACLRVYRNRRKLVLRVTCRQCRNDTENVKSVDLLEKQVEGALNAHR